MKNNMEQSADFQEIEKEVQRVQKIKIFLTSVVILVMVALTAVFWNATAVYKVELEGDKQAGYQWNYTFSQDKILKEKSSTYSDGLFTFEFVGINRGKTKIEFTCKKNNQLYGEMIVHEVRVDKALKIISTAMYNQNL